MSRIPFDNVWMSVYGARGIGTCLLCAHTIKQDEHLRTSCAWNRSHIISLADGGLDILPNVIPLFPKCNSAMGRQDYFSYLVKIKRIDEVTARRMREEHIQMCRNYRSRCELGTCRNNKCLKNMKYCWQHMPKVSPMPID